MGKAKPVNKDQASCKLPGSCCRPTLLLNLHVLSLLYKMGRMKWRFLITFQFPLFQGEFILPICSVASTWMCQPTLLADEDGAYRNSLFIPLSVSQCVLVTFILFHARHLPVLPVVALLLDPLIPDYCRDYFTVIERNVPSAVIWLALSFLGGLVESRIKIFRCTCCFPDNPRKLTPLCIDGEIM